MVASKNKIKKELFQKNKIIVKILDISASLHGKREVHSKSDIDFILVISDTFSDQESKLLKRSIRTTLTRYKPFFRHPPYIISESLFNEMKYLGVHQNYFDKNRIEVDLLSKKLSLLEWSLDQSLIATWKKFTNSAKEYERVKRKLKRNIEIATQFYGSSHYIYHDNDLDLIESVKEITKLVSEECYAEFAEKIEKKSVFFCIHKDYNSILFSDSKSIIILSKIIQKMTGFCIVTFPKSSYLSFLVFEEVFDKKTLPKNGILVSRYTFYMRYKAFLRAHSLEKFSLELPAMYVYFLTKHTLSF